MPLFDDFKEVVQVEGDKGLVHNRARSHRAHASDTKHFKESTAISHVLQYKFMKLREEVDNLDKHGPVKVLMKDGKWL